MKINWGVRIRNKAFWMTFIPALALVVSSVLNVFGVKMEFGDLVDKLLAVVTAVFALLAIMGVVNDPTTSGVGDSERALTYEIPWDDDSKNGGKKTE